MKPLEIVQTAPNQVCVKRSFDAPLNLVWRAFTEPELVKRWLTGPPGHTMPICEIDFQVGGKWRYVWLIPTDEMLAYGEFREIETHHKIVHTETFEMWPDSSSLVTSLFEENNGKTQVTMIMEFGDQETRDMAFRTGMTDGMETSFARLDGILPEYQLVQA